MNYADIKNKILYWSLIILTILLGVFFVIYGEIDDSPGGQLIGLGLVVIGIVFVFKCKNVMHAIQTDEYLDLVDESDHVIGKKKRSEVYAEHLSNFRVVNAFVVNSRGEIWIPRRVANKRIFPLCLDMSIGGHVESGETYEQTLKRETQEELNVDIDTAQVRFLGHLTPQKDGVSAFMNVYEIKMEEAPNYNKDDFTEYFWLSPKALFERIDQGERIKGDLPILVKIFYGHSLLYRTDPPAGR